MTYQRDWESESVRRYMTDNGPKGTGYVRDCYEELIAARARLAAVIAVLDEPIEQGVAPLRVRIRAAATGDPKFEEEQR